MIPSRYGLISVLLKNNYYFFDLLSTGEYLNDNKKPKLLIFTFCTPIFFNGSRMKGSAWNENPLPISVSAPKDKSAILNQ